MERGQSGERRSLPDGLSSVSLHLFDKMLELNRKLAVEKENSPPDLVLKTAYTKSRFYRQLERIRAQTLVLNQ